MGPLMADRLLLRRRLVGAVEAAARLNVVIPTRMAAIGFCFGGLCVLDLARANAPLRGVVSFHGVLGAPAGLTQGSIGVPILALHGWDDPMATPPAVLALTKELSEAGADWQLHAYGGTMHAFMVQGLDQPHLGLQYNERSARRAWIAMAGFLEETLADAPHPQSPLRKMKIGLRELPSPCRRPHLPGRLSRLPSPGGRGVSSPAPSSARKVGVSASQLDHDLSKRPAVEMIERERARSPKR